MKPAPKRQRGKSGLELIEESIHLLRMAPGATLAAYYIGSLPFIFGLLYFWADMSRNPFAYDHLAPAALALSLLFLWMKTWQAVFAIAIRAQASVAAPLPLTIRRWFRIFVVQSVLQPSGLFMLPLALLPGALPVGWFYAFYQNVTALADGDDIDTRKLFKRSYKQCIYRAPQNHIILAILFLFGMFVFLNFATVCLALPGLLKALLGVESVYSRSPMSMLNTTFLAAMFGLTYLCLDPIIKTVYVLRCFYGESVQSGEDLKADLRPYSIAVKVAITAAASVLMVGTVCFATAKSPNKNSENPKGIPSQSPATVLRGTSYPGKTDKDKYQPQGGCDVCRIIAAWRNPFGVEDQSNTLTQGSAWSWSLRSGATRATLDWRAQSLWDWGFVNAATMNFLAAAEPESPDSSPVPNTTPAARPTSSTPQESISPPSLDRSIEKTISKSKYSWRMPREKIVRDQTQGPIGRFIDAVIRTLKNWIKKVLGWIGDVLEWIFRHLRLKFRGGSGNWIGSLQGLLFILIVLVVCALALLLLRAWQNSHREVKVVESEAIHPVPDIADENVGAEQLPEDAWTKLGRESLARGEFRLALRAFYFASLAHLSTRNLIAIAKFKSNRDYERELRRRGHSLPEMLSLFGENVSVFDRSWYGLRDVDAATVNDFASKVERIKTTA